jgi:DNA-binding transcriptional ArsR family regulator
MANISPFDQITGLFQLLGQPARLQILLAIGKGEPCVCHLEAVLGWRQAYLSQHLMALRKAGMVSDRRVGRNIHYRLNDPAVLDLIQRTAEMQSLSLPRLSPSPDCNCPNCKQERDEHEEDPASVC